MIALINRMLLKFGIGEFSVNREHLSQISWLGWGQGVSLILSLVSIKLTTAIGPSEYGHFVLVTSIGGLLSLSFFGPLEQGFVRYYFEFSKTEEQRSAYLGFVMNVMRTASVILAVFAAAAVIAGVNVFHKGLLFMTVSALLVMISVIITPFSGLFNAMKLRKEISIIQVLEKGIIILFLLLAARYMNMDSAAVMTAIVGAMVIFAVVRIFIFRRQATVLPSETVIQSVSKESWKKIILYGWPFILWGWISWFQFNGERWVINAYLTVGDVGKYGLSASMVNNSIVMVYSVFIQFLTPSIYGKFATGIAVERAKGYSLIKIAAAATFILFLCFGLFLFLAGEQVIHLLSTKEYVIDTSLLLLLTVGLGIFYVGQTLAMVGFALQMPDAYIIPKVLSALLSLTGYIAGCLWFGLYGIVYAILIGNSIYLISIIVINKRMLLKQL